MASPVTPLPVRSFSVTAVHRNMSNPLSGERFLKKIKESGLDEASIKRRDKAALVGYIATLEAEVMDLQDQIDVLVLEKNELNSKFEQIKSSTEASNLAHKCEVASHLTALAEARKREERLKKSVGVEKECIANMEKVLHEVRAEYAEAKITSDSKLAEAQKMMEDAQEKLLNAEAKLRSAESLQAEAKVSLRTSERKLQEAEEHEEDIRRRVREFKADCEAKDKEIVLERQSLSDRSKALQREHERLLDAQNLLSQRENHIDSKAQEVNRLESELRTSKENIESELRALSDEKMKMELNLASLTQREEAIFSREASLSQKEQELFVLQERIISKESAELQKLLADQEAVIKARKSEIDAEFQKNRRLVEDEIETKRRAWELKEVDFKQREDLLSEKEHEIEVRSEAMSIKEKGMIEKKNGLDEKERALQKAQKEIEVKSGDIRFERDEIDRKKTELQNSLRSMEEEKEEIRLAREKLAALKNETEELVILEKNLKEEVDSLRSQKLELSTEEERMKKERSKFESEWEMIEEKREQLQKEIGLVSEERNALSRLLKGERDSLRHEKKMLEHQHKNAVELLNTEKEEFMKKMTEERSELFNKIQQEHTDLLLDIEMRKLELEHGFEKRQEELETHLRDRELAFELQKKNELEHVQSLREKAEKEMEIITLEFKKLQDERAAVNSDREKREKEWVMLNRCIEELKQQTEKLEEQRELLRVERGSVSSQVEQLRSLEDLKLALDHVEVSELQQSSIDVSMQKISALRFLKRHHHDSQNGIDILSKTDMDARLRDPDYILSPDPIQSSWINRCAELFFKNSREKNTRTSSNGESPGKGEDHGAMKPRESACEDVKKKKRRIGYSSLDGAVDPPMEERRYQKKPKLQEDAEDQMSNFVSQNVVHDETATASNEMVNDSGLVTTDTIVKVRQELSSANT